MSCPCNNCPEPSVSIVKWRPIPTTIPHVDGQFGSHPKAAPPIVAFPVVLRVEISTAGRERISRKEPGAFEAKHHAGQWPLGANLPQRALLHGAWGSSALAGRVHSRGP